MDNSTSQLLPWLLDPYNNIEQLYINNKLPKVLLLHGVYGVGKSSMAFAIAKLLLCCSHLPVNCSCSNCLKFNNNNFPPDLLVLGENDVVVKVDDIRDLIEDANKTSFDISSTNSNKVFVILNAENMNNFASNALLKILESDTNNNNYFIITSSMYSKLLPTITSRCYKISVSLSKIDEEIYSWFAKHGLSDKQQQDLLLELSNYAPLKAIDYFNKKYIDKLNNLIIILDELNQHNLKQQSAKIIKIFSSADTGKSFDFYGFFDVINFVLVKFTSRKINYRNIYKIINLINNYKSKSDLGISLDHSNMLFRVLYGFTDHLVEASLAK